jgi:hypothetical protein
VYQLGLEGVDLADRPLAQTVVAGRVATMVYIPYFKGVMCIEKLDVFPLRFHPAGAQLQKTIVCWGQKLGSSSAPSLPCAHTMASDLSPPQPE